MSRRSVRVRRVSFTVTPAEKRRFRAAARRLGASVAELVRRAMARRVARGRPESPGG